MAINEGPEEGGFRAGIETGPDGKPTGNIICYPTFSPNCKVVTLPSANNLNSGFVSLPEPTRFHDKALIEASQEINKILVKVTQETKRNNPKASLHVYLAHHGPMLIWADAMAMPTDDIRKGSAMKHAAM
jgi:hypothetical protein